MNLAVVLFTLQLDSEKTLIDSFHIFVCEGITFLAVISIGNHMLLMPFTITCSISFIFYSLMNSFLNEVHFHLMLQAEYHLSCQSSLQLSSQ